MMKFSLLSVVLLASAPRQAHADELFVSPTGKGVDCTRTQPCGLIEARDSIRKLLPRRKATINVNLMGGDYSMSGPLELDDRDSGEVGYPVSWRALQKENAPVLNGGKTVMGWTLFDAARGIWRAPVTKETNARQFYVDGVRADRTRTADLLRSGFEATQTGYRFYDPVTGLPIDFSNYGNLRDMEVVRSVNWQLSRCAVVFASASEVVVNPVCFANSRTANLTIFIENAFELLRTPGQWYLDRTGTVTGDPAIYYIPRAGQNLLQVRSILPVAESLLTIAGRDPSRKVHDISIQGLTFAYSTWRDDRGSVGKVGGYAGLQAGVYLLSFADFLKADSHPRPGDISRPEAVAGGFYDPVNLGYTDYIPAAVTVNYAERVNIVGNSFFHIGSTALALVHGIVQSNISANVLRDIGGVGIQLGGVEDHDRNSNKVVTDQKNDMTTQDNKISNNRISYIGQDYFDAVGIFVGYTRNTSVDHNELTDLPYTGISMGWGWGWFDKNGVFGRSTPTVMENNHIVFNRVSRFNLKQRDGGGIYTLSSQPRSSITNNYISDSPNDFAGIYQDEGSSGFSVNNNVVIRVPYAIHINCGKHDLTFANVFYSNFSDTGAVRNGCARGINQIEPVRIITKHTTASIGEPAEIIHIDANAGLQTNADNSP